MKLHIILDNEDGTCTFSDDCKGAAVCLNNQASIFICKSNRMYVCLSISLDLAKTELIWFSFTVKLPISFYPKIYLFTF